MVKGFKNTEIGIIPEDWDTAYIKDLALIKTGSRNTQDRIENGLYPFFVRSQTIERINSYSFDGEAILTAGDGVGVGKVFHYLNGKFDCHQRVYRITDFAENLNGYFFYLYFSHNFLNRIMQMTAKSSVDSVRKDMIANMQIPLPPTKAEQTAIATALSDADALISVLEKLIAKKKAMKQGAVQELFKPQKGWQTKSLGDIANIRRGASPRPIKDPKWFSQKGRGWIRISDVTSSNVYLNSTTQYLSEEGVKYSVPVDKGDLIMSICATIGVPVIINIPACIHDGFVLFSDYENNLDTFYLYFFLQKETDALVGKGQPGTQKNLNISIVGNIEISYPSVEEQKKIGLILKDIDIELSGLEQRLEKQKQLKQGMMQSLLTGKIRLV